MAYLIDFAKSRSLEYRKDSTGNVVIRKGASPGMENRPVVVLQSHVDMVCEKRGDVNFHFDTDPIRTRVEDGWVRAEGTTLGADCGIGMAAELAVLDADDLAHGPVECLFTVDEETGLTGAFGLGEGMLSGKYLINLDSEDEGQLFTAAPEESTRVATMRYRQEEAPKNYDFFRIDIGGLLGGHSGDDIDKGRANSNKLLARFLWLAARQTEMRHVYLDGRKPPERDSPARLSPYSAYPSRDAKRLRELFEEYVRGVGQEFAPVEKSMEITLSEMPEPDTVIDADAQRYLLYALCGLPNGVLAMSRRCRAWSRPRPIWRRSSSSATV